jgi:hypothetical protein
VSLLKKNTYVCLPFKTKGLLMEKKQNKGWSNLKPIQKGEVRNTTGIAGRKKGLERLIREALTPQDLKDIVANVATEAKQGNIKAAEFIFDRLYGKPTVMVDLLDSKGATVIQNNFNLEVKGQDESELTSLLIELSNNDNNEDDSDVEILE